MYDHGNIRASCVLLQLVCVIPTLLSKRALISASSMPRGPARIHFRLFT